MLLRARTHQVPVCVGDLCVLGCMNSVDLDDLGVKLNIIRQEQIEREVS